METLKNQTKQFHVAEIHLSYRPGVMLSQLPKVSDSRDVYKIFLEQWDKDKIEFIEQFKVMFLNRANKVLGILEVSSGSSTGTLVDPRLIFAAALKANACSVIVSHNHPSGNLTPSERDKQITKKLKAGGEFLEVSVLDHIIVTAEGYYSFADEGQL